jgi:hypothetical protein
MSPRTTDILVVLILIVLVLLTELTYIILIFLTELLIARLKNELAYSEVLKMYSFIPREVCWKFFALSFHLAKRY